MARDSFELSGTEATENAVDGRQSWDWSFALSYDGENYDWNNASTHLFNVASRMMASVRNARDRQTVDNEVAKLEIAMGLLHSGIAVELIAKAFLAELSPGTIGADARSGLILSGHEEWLSSPLTVKTISGHAALSLAREIIKNRTNAQPWSAQDEQKILEARNAVAHLGAIHQEADHILVLAIKVFQTILRNLDLYRSLAGPRIE